MGARIKATFLQRKNIFILLFSLLFFLLIPDFTVRITIIIFYAVFVLLTYKVLKREYIFLIFSFFYLLAYIYSPYWNIFSAVPYKILAFILLPAAGFFWAYHISSDVKISIEPVNKSFLVLLTVMVYLVNYRPLSANIPWMGDEDFHINCVIALSKYIDIILTLSIDFVKKEPLVAATAGLVLILTTLFLLKSKLSVYKKAIILISLLSLPAGAVILRHPLSFTRFTVVVLRYPFFQKWFNLFFTYPYLYSQIALYRAVPFLSSVFLGWFLFYKFYGQLKKRWLSLFLSFSVVTIPLLYYYTSLLYLEMPVTTLMTVCVFNIAPIISLEYKELRRTIPWYCLLLISFLKETASIFILIILGARFIYQLRHSNYKNRVKCILGEIKICFFVLFPLFVYLFFRVFFSSFRRYGMHFHNLFYIPNYFVFMQGLFTQTGILFVIGVLGLLVLFKKDRVVFGVLLALLVGTMCFFIIDDSHYAGYSRWNLYLLPVLLFASFDFIISVKKYLLPALAFAMLISNILLIPIHFDGNRYSNWGCPRGDIGEPIYPYKEAIKWLSEQNNIRYLLFTGNYYPYYGLVFYLNKYNFHPILLYWKFARRNFSKVEEEQKFHRFFQRYSRLVKLRSSNKILSGATFLKADTILYHSVNDIKLNIGSVYGGFKVIRKISNSENTLYILRKSQL